MCVSRVCANLCWCPALTLLFAWPGQCADRGHGEAPSDFGLIVKCLSAMYRSASLENEEMMALYGGERNRYLDRDEDCISEVRL